MAEQASAAGAGAPENDNAPSSPHPLLAHMLGLARGDAKPISTPWRSVNRELRGGFRAGCHFVVGNPKTGKTQFAVQLAVEAAQQGSPVVYVALEPREVDIQARLLAVLAGRKWSDLLAGDLAEQEVMQLWRSHGAELRSLPITVVERPAAKWDPEELPQLIGSARAEHSPSARRTPFVVVDYLQIVGGKHRELRERIGSAAYAGREAARSYGAAVLLISATARSHYQDLDARISGESSEPLGSGSAIRFASMGKESGEVEYAADTCIALIRGQDDEPGEHGAVVHVAFPLVRLPANDATEWARLQFDGSRFVDDRPAADVSSPPKGARPSSPGKRRGRPRQLNEGRGRPVDPFRAGGK